MEKSEYVTGIGELYAAEVLGEGLANRWLELAVDPIQKYKLGLFLQLESEAKVRLRPLLSRLGLSVVEEESVRREGEARADRVAAQPWSATLSEWGAWIAQAIRDYQTLARTAPAEDRETLEYMVRHEQVLAAFLAGERAEQGAAALAPVLDFLSHPLPRGSRS